MLQGRRVFSRCWLICIIGTWHAAGFRSLLSHEGHVMVADVSVHLHDLVEVAVDLSDESKVLRQTLWLLCVMISFDLI
jgi:hypothetical protein